MLLMKVFARKWRQQGILCFIYLDDILILATTAKQVEQHLKIILEDLAAAGMQVNKEKSQLFPSQNITHLGFVLDLKNGCLQVTQEKLKSVRRDLGKLLTRSDISCRKLAAILGQVRSFLTVIPLLRDCSFL